MSAEVQIIFDLLFLLFVVIPMAILFVYSSNRDSSVDRMEEAGRRAAKRALADGRLMPYPEDIPPEARR